MPKQRPEAYQRMGVTMRENKAIEAYLQYLATKKLPLPTGIDGKREALEQRIKNEKRLVTKVQLISDLHALERPTVTAEDLVEGFVKNAPGFAERTGVTYQAWREMGVPVEVLKQAGFEPPAGRSVGATNRKPKDPSAPKRVRRQRTPEFLDEVRAYVEAHGADAAAKHYGYAKGYVIDMIRFKPV